MNHMWNMLGLARITAIPMIGSSEDAEDVEYELQSGESTKPNETHQVEMKMSAQQSSKGQEKDNEEAEHDAKKDPEAQHDVFVQDGDASLSSISFYDDFPKLYFAVRNGRYVKNSVFLSWDSAREQIVDYPNAEYIATPTLAQAHNYTNGFGEFDNTIHEDQNDSSQQMQLESSRPLSSKLPVSLPLEEQGLSEKKPKPLSGLPMVNPRKRKYTTRKLLLEYYKLYDPGYKAKGQNPLTIPQFLKEREMYHAKFKSFTKHWQRSGLLMMCNEEKPLQEAIYKYDNWVRRQKLEKLGIDLADIMNQQTTNDNNRKKDKSGKTRKRRRPVVMLSSAAKDNNRNDSNMNFSPDSGRRSEDGYSPDFDTKNKPPSRKRKRKPPISRKVHMQKQTNKDGFESSPIDATILKKMATNGQPLNYHNESDDDDDDNDERFNTMYEKLKIFHSQHGHCKVTKSHNPELAYFVSYTRRRMRVEADRKGARALTLREEKLLNDLDFDPVYKEIVTEFNKYLGMRVAKLFDVVVTGEDTDNEENDSVLIQKGVSRIKRVPFFGTVGRISSVCNRYLRIKYDDGDSEDFDLDCLMDGLRLYNKHKHKDILHGAKKVAPSAKPSEASLTNQNVDKSKSNKFDKDDMGGKSGDDMDNDNDIDNSNFDVINSKQNQATTPEKSISSDVRSKIPSIGEGDKTSKPTNSGDGSEIGTEKTAELGKLPKSTITPETNPAFNDPTEMRDSDHSSINQFPMNINENDDDDDIERADGDMIDVNSSENDGGEKNTGNGDENENENDSEGDSTSSDEVEFVGVMVPYRGNPSLLGFSNTGGDGAMHYDEDGDNGNNPFNVYEEGVYDF